MRKRSEVFLLFVILSISLISLISAGNYGAGRYGIGVFNIGEVPVVPPSGGGGGGVSCTYNWNCTNWFPAECPVQGIQERVCANKGTCSGLVGMPDETRTCIYEHKEPLFDVFLTIPQQYEKICAGNKIKANIKLENYGKIELLDAFMTYWIIDKNNTLISESKDTRNVADKLNFDVSINVPDLTPIGTYRLYAQITYSENKTAVAGGTFEIVEKDYCEITFNISRNLPFILISIGFLIVFILIIILYKKFHHHLRARKEIRVKRRKIRKEQGKNKLIEFFKKLRRRLRQRAIKRRELGQREERLRYQRKIGRNLLREKQKRLAEQRIARRRLEEERRKKYNEIVRRRRKEERKRKNRLRWLRFVKSLRIKRKSPEEIEHKKIAKLIKKKNKKKLREERRKKLFEKRLAKKRLKEERKKVKRIKKIKRIRQKSISRKIRKVRTKKIKHRDYHHMREKIDRAFFSKRFGNLNPEIENLRNKIRDKGVRELELHKKGRKTKRSR
jgi:hypothetical protein